jgi:hypothetical protein
MRKPREINCAPFNGLGGGFGETLQIETFCVEEFTLE